MESFKCRLNSTGDLCADGLRHVIGDDGDSPSNDICICDTCPPGKFEETACTPASNTICTDCTTIDNDQMVVM